ncbi:MAG: hypothetical protein KF878_13510 [Planctomycetes bacterium]|nr:hypothetical protein [Planctomycetota bacterium]
MEHESLRAAALEALDPARRRQLHRQAARLLESRHPVATEPLAGGQPRDRADELRWHHAQAGDVAEAISWTRVAADAAVKRRELVRARELAREALDLLDSAVAAGTFAPPPGFRAHLLLRHADALAATGDRTAALALLAARAGDPAAGDLAPWEAALAERLAWERVLAHNAAVARAAPAALRPTPEELEQVRLTNEHRMALGRAPLELDLRLVAAARGHAADMARLAFFDHASPVPGCESPGDRLARAGYEGPGGENIARGPETPRAAHEQWTASLAHHRNLLDPAWRAVGVGRAGRLWTQCFGADGAYER